MTTYGYYRWRGSHLKTKIHLRIFVYTVICAAICVCIFSSCGSHSSGESSSASETAVTIVSPEEPSATTSNENVITIKLATTLSDSTFHYHALQRFKEKVEQDSEGTVFVELYPNAQLGDASDLIRAMQAGTLELAFLDTAAGVPFYPELALPEALFLSRDESHKLAILRSDKMTDILTRMVEDIGVRYFDYSIESVCSIWTTQPVTSFRELQDMNIAIPNEDNTVAYTDMFEVFGMNPAPVAVKDIYVALHDGTTDGLAYSITGMMDKKLYGLCGNCYQTGHSVVTLAFMGSEKFWEKLNPDQQMQLLEAMSLTSRELINEYYESKWTALKYLKQQGVNFVSPTDEDLEKMRDLARPLIIESVKDFASEEDIDELLALN